MGWLEDTRAYSGTESVKCPNCGANIFYNEKVGKVVCHMCGGLYETKSLKPWVGIAVDIQIRGMW